MSCDRTEAVLISRRRILWGGAFAAAASAAAIIPAQARAAQKKMTQAAVNYQPRPKSGAYCLHCAVFQEPNACALVEGDVSRNGWCTLFTPK
jgi:hypothetical protein